MPLSVGDPFAESRPINNLSSDEEKKHEPGEHKLSKNMTMEEREEEIDEEVFQIEDTLIEDTRIKDTLEKLEHAEKQQQRHLIILMTTIFFLLLCVAAITAYQTYQIALVVDAHDHFEIGDGQGKDSVLKDRKGHKVETAAHIEYYSISMACNIKRSTSKPMRTFSIAIPAEDTKANKAIMVFVSVASSEYVGYDKLGESAKQVLIRGTQGEMVQIPCAGSNQKLALSNFPVMKQNRTALIDFVSYEEMMMIEEEMKKVKKTGKNRNRSRNLETQTSSINLELQTPSICEKYYQKACLQFSKTKKTGSTLNPICDCEKVCKNDYEIERANIINKEWCENSDIYKMYKDSDNCSDTLPCPKRLDLVTTFY
eukprot:g6033.t1